MAFPGEHLLGRLWETLAEKGIGSLLRPGQMRREGLAALELDRLKKLSDAQAERDVEDIRSGRKDLEDFSLRLKLSSDSNGQVVRRRTEPTFSLECLTEIALAQNVDDVVRRHINTEKAIIYAEESLKEDAAVPPDEKVDADWLYRWRDYTGSVSNDELQRLWGRLLSGEVKEPGTYSLRCLDFMRNLTQSDAKLIESLSSLLIQKFIWRPERRADSYPLSIDDLLDLQNLGIISGVDSTGLEIQFDNSNVYGVDYIRVLTSHDRCIVVRHENKEAILNFGAYPVTKLGLQLISLGTFKANVSYLESLSRSIAGKGFRVSLAYPVPSEEGYTRWRDPVEID